MCSTMPRWRRHSTAALSGRADQFLQDLQREVATGSSSADSMNTSSMSTIPFVDYDEGETAIDSIHAHRPQSSTDGTLRPQKACSGRTDHPESRYMSEHIILVDSTSRNGKGLPLTIPWSRCDLPVDPPGRTGAPAVLNLCRDTDYHSPGYTRRCWPRRGQGDSHAHAAGPEPQGAVWHRTRRPRRTQVGEAVSRSTCRDHALRGAGDVSGECEAQALHAVSARAVSSMFRAPLIKVELKRSKVWHITGIRSVGTEGGQTSQPGSNVLRCDGRLSCPWRSARSVARARCYDLAILIRPEARRWPSRQAGAGEGIRARARRASTPS